MNYNYKRIEESKPYVFTLKDIANSSVSSFEKELSKTVYVFKLDLLNITTDRNYNKLYKQFDGNGCIRFLASINGGKTK